MSEIDLSTNNVLTVDLGNSIDYTNIANKPSINSVELFGNKTSSQLGLQSELTNGYTDLTNKPKINSVELSGNKTSADLSMYTKAEVDTAISSAISGVTSFNYTVVSELPASGVKGTIYLVPNGETENKHDEYLWISEGVQTPYWEKMGPKDLDISGKVDKVTTTNKLYGTDAVGGQTTYDKSDFASVSDIPTKTSDLTNDSGFLTEHQDISGKLDKVTTSTSNTQVYIKLKNGTQAMIPLQNVENEVTGFSIPIKMANGEILVPDNPQWANAATPKTYVLNQLATKQDTLTAGTGIDITDNVISASEEWELINSGSIQDDFVNQFTINKDSNGNDFSLKKIIFLISNVTFADSSTGEKHGAVYINNVWLLSGSMYIGQNRVGKLSLEYNGLFWNCLENSNHGGGNTPSFKSTRIVDNFNQGYATSVMYFNGASFKCNYKLYGVRA